MRSSSRRAAFLRRPRHPAGRRHVLRARPRDHRRRPRHRPDHRDRRGQGPRRRVPRHVPDARQPGPGDPADDHGAHRHHRVDGRSGAAIEAVLPSMLEFLGDAVVVGHNVGFDLAFLNAALDAPRRSGDRQPGHRHPAAGPPPGPRRGARLPARHAWRRASGSTTSRRTAPSTTRSPPPTCCTSCSSGPPASACSGSTTSSRLPRIAGHPQAGKLRMTARSAAHPRRVPVPRRQRSGALRRQGHQPAPAGAQLLRQRRPPQDRPRCCARRSASRMSPRPTCSPPKCSSSAISSSSNRATTRSARRRDKYRYVRLTTDEAWPRLSVVNDATGTGVSPRSAAVQGQRRPRRRSACSPCSRCGAARPRLGRSVPPHPTPRRARRRSSAWPMCPCAGAADARHYAAVVANAVQAMTTSPELVIARAAGPARRAVGRSVGTKRPPRFATGRWLSPTRCAASDSPTGCARPATSACQLGDTMLHLATWRAGRHVGSTGRWRSAFPCRRPTFPDHRSCSPAMSSTRSCAWPAPSNESPIELTVRVVRWPLAMAGRRGARGRRAFVGAPLEPHGGLVGVDRRQPQSCGFDHGAAVVDAQHLGVAVRRHAAPPGRRRRRAGTSPPPSGPTPTTTSTMPRRRAPPASASCDGAAEASRRSW